MGKLRVRLQPIISKPKGEKVTEYFNDAVITATKRIQSLTCYYHKEPCPGKFGGTALAAVQPYTGNMIPKLTGSVVFTDFAKNEEAQPPVRGLLAYTRARADCQMNDYGIIEIDYDFGSKPAYFVSLGTNLVQTRLFLGVYGSANVTGFDKGTVFEIVP